MGEDTISGGWLQSLDLYMQEKVELHVAFYANWKEEVFRCRKTTYHVIPPGNIRKSNIKNILIPNVLFTEDTPIYRAIIERVKPDIIHVHGTENAYGSFMSLINIPVVCSIQGIVSPYAYRAEGDALKDINSKISRTGHGLKSLLFEKGLKHQYRLLQLMATRETQYFSEYRNFIGRTEWDRRISSVMAPGSKYFLGDEIMRDAFYKSQWTPVERSEKWIIHTTASDHPMKGFRTIVDAVRLLKRIDIEMEWRVAGLSESSSVVRVLKKELGGKYPGESIRLLGRINSDELVARMLEAHVFVLPSYMENSPNSLCEAMMLGMPCIATNSGGIPSILQDRDEGILIQTRDPWVMAGALLEIFDDPSGAIQKGIAARRRALLRHDPIRIADQTLHVYNSILGI